MIIFTSYLKKFEKLSDAQFGQLIKTGLKYIESGEMPQIEDVAVALSFDVIKYEIDKNNNKYKEICEKRRIAGQKGGLAKAENAKEKEANLASASNSYQEVANDSKASKTKQDVASSSINKHKHKHKHDIKSTLSEERVPEKASKPSNASLATFSAPSLEEVREYCSSRNSVVDPETFVDYYEAIAWDGVKDWKAKVRVWEKREKPKEDNPPEGVIKKSIFKTFAQRDYDFNALEEKLVNKSG